MLYDEGIFEYDMVMTQVDIGQVWVGVSVLEPHDS